MRLLADHPLPHLIRSAVERDAAEVHFDLYNGEPPSDERFRVDFADHRGALRFSIDKNGTRVSACWAPETEIKLINDVASLLAGPILGGVLRLRGIVSLHGSVIEVAGAAVLLLGDQGAGKSTIGARLAQDGHAVLSDDVAAIRDHVDGGWVVQPGYPRLRLHPTVLHATEGARDAGPVMTGNDKRYVELSLDRDAPAWRFQRNALPLATVVELRRSGTVKRPTVEPITGVDRLALLLRHTRHALGPLDRSVRARELGRLGRLSADVTMLGLDYPDGLNHLSGSCATIVNAVRSQP